MIKNILYILVLFCFISCDTESGSDCFKTPGNTITKSYVLENFSEVIINEDIELEIRQGAENEVYIEYGNNIIDNIKTEIIDDKLSITNTTSCNLIKDFKPAKVVLTAIDISEIRNASQHAIFSGETLSYNSLTLISEDHEIDYVNVGDFNLDIDNQFLHIVTNNVSNFYIKGNTENLNIVFAAGTGKFNGELLSAENVHIFHRGTNNIIINPINKITGEIRGTGNVIAINRPPIVDVTEFYTGQLIFRN